MELSASLSETPNVTDQRQFATDFMKFVKAEDTKFCIDILENIQVLSEDIRGDNLSRNSLLLTCL